MTPGLRDTQKACANRNMDLLRTPGTTPADDMHGQICPLLRWIHARHCRGLHGEDTCKQSNDSPSCWG